MATRARTACALLLAVALFAVAGVGVAGAVSDQSPPADRSCPAGSAVADGECVATVVDGQSAPPDAAFWGERYPEPGEQVTYDGRRSTDDGEIVAYTWYLDGTVVEEGETFTTSFDSGTYDLTLVVRDDDGQEDSVSETITVAQNTPPTAAFTYDPSDPVAGESITFNGSPSSDDDGQVFFWEWYIDGDFASESTSFTQSLPAGTHNVTLVVQDDDGATDRETRFVDVGPANQPPQPAFSYTPSAPTTADTVTFDASASSDPDGEVVRYLWDFQDDGQIDANTTDPVVQYGYAQPGTYLATLTVVDDDGARRLTEDSVPVTRPPPTAACTLSATNVEPGGTVTVDASGSENATFVEFDTDGDGQYDRSDETDFVVQRTYEEPGEYPVTVRARNGDLADTADCGTVVVSRNEPPTASFTVSDDQPTVGDTVTFDASASSDPDGTVVQYRWDFDGDGVTDETTTSPTTTHTYTTAGSYGPTLVVVDDDEAAGRTSRDLRVRRPAPVATCTVDPTTIAPGGSVVVDASGSENTVFVEFDLDGDGQYDRGDETDFVVEHTYEEPGEYPVTARASGGGRTDVAECGTVVVRANQPPEASFTASDDQPSVGDTVTFDASASSDPDGTIVEYRWDLDGDGTADETTTSPTVTLTVDDTGPLVVSLEVVDDDGATDRTGRDLSVQPRPPTAACSLSTTEVSPGGSVVVDASESADADFVEFDTDGDGEFETTDETDFRVETTLNETGEYPVRVRAVAGDLTDVADCGTLVVARPGTTPDEEESDPGFPIPWIPIAGGGALLLVGYGAYRYLTRGGTPQPERPQRPKRAGSRVTPRYDAGVFAVPPTSGTVRVDDVGFEPDLVLLTATNAARADEATDRTAGWTRGAAWQGADGSVQQSVTVADDAASTDQGTVATTTGAALDVVRHDDDLHGRIRARVQSTDAYGFDVEVAVPDEDPTAGGIRVLYQAFRTASDADVEVGEFLTPTEPGGQAVSLGVDADYVSLLGSSSVGDLDRTWTTDRSVGLSVGTAVGREEVEQTVWNGTVDPSPENHRSAAGSATDALHLLYQDRDDIAGRTTAAVTNLGEELRLRYDRVYSGPHKLGSVARHVVQYLAMDTGAEMTPAAGAFRLPPPGETVDVDCGFAPALVEFTTCGLDELGDERVADAAAEPFGWSHGAAVVRGDVLEQYVLHSSTAGGVPDAESRGDTAGGTATDATGTAGATAADGGQDAGSDTPDLDRTARGGAPAAGTTDGTPAPRSGRGLPSNVTDPGLSRGPGSLDTGIPTDVGAPDVVDALPSGEAAGSPHALRHGGDGVVGAWLARNAAGAVTGREEFRVERRTDRGFVVGVGDVSTGAADATERESRPFVFYRAWPDPDVATGTDERATEAGAGGTDTAASGTDTTATGGD